MLNIKLICFTLTVVCSVVFAETPTPEERQKYLDEHNKFRSMVANGELGNQPQACNMVVMEWDDKALESAQRRAEQCVASHDQNADRKYSPYSWIGQNIAMFSSIRQNPFDGVKNWVNEETDYNFNAKSCSRVCGHYTQVAWYASKGVGCAKAVCETGWTQQVYCNYGPGGNYRGQAPYSVGKACTCCPQGYTKCMGGLCALPRHCEGQNCTDSVTSSSTIQTTEAVNAQNVIARNPHNSNNNNNDNSNDNNDDSNDNNDNSKDNNDDSNDNNDESNKTDDMNDDSKNCYHPNKNDYTGPMSQTGKGLECMPWTELASLTHWRYLKDENFAADGGMAGAGNKCRNPAKYKKPFCYVRSGYRISGYFCKVDLCADAEPPCEDFCHYWCIKNSHSCSRDWVKNNCRKTCNAC